MKTHKLVLHSVEDTQKFTCQLSELIEDNLLPLHLGLQGPLGAGKTTLCRELLHQLGYRGKVKSPSYSLIESYQTNQLLVHHIDAYRLKSGEERELGLESFLAEKALVLIEWVEKLDLQMDLYINFHMDSHTGSSIDAPLNAPLYNASLNAPLIPPLYNSTPPIYPIYRTLQLEGKTSKGKELLARLLNQKEGTNSDSSDLSASSLMDISPKRPS